MKKLFAIIVILAVSCGIANAGVNRDSLQAAIAESLRTKLFQGELLLHFPLMVIPLDSSSGGGTTWFPVPEMGFRFTPTIGFQGGWFAFPVRVMGMFPFTDDWATLGDVSAGCEVHAPPYHVGVSYRYFRGRIFPVKSRIQAHVVGFDLGIPVEELGGSGVAVDWVVYAELDFDGNYMDNQGVLWDGYDGNILTITPYWAFSPGDYGKVTLAYRFSVLQQFTGYMSVGGSRDMGKQGISLIELRYVYP